MAEHNQIQPAAIFAVSDASGETAERIVQSALVQFVDAPVSIIRRGQINDAQQVKAVVREAAEKDAPIIHTLVSSDLRALILEQSRLHHVEAVDLMGPVLDRLTNLLKASPLQQPGLLSQLIEARTREIEAVEYAFRHDDGQHPEELDRADIVLVGISRTMKTPTTLYLAYRGWFAANVPIVPEIPMPDELFAVPAERVFCLDMSPSRLVDLRRVRANSLKLPLEPYATLEYARQELTHARQLCIDHGWRRVDVTDKSVEEATREILTLLAISS
ncbi:MAG: pyruvate, water dikinase regulatory protein [Armatimonadota bacterium]|nr:kinase/pyrophosphorylase [bacterium]